MAPIGELGLFAFDLGQTSVGIGAGAVGVVGPTLTAKVDVGVAARRGSTGAGVFLVCLFFGAEALERGRRFDQSTVHAEVLAGEKLGSFGLRAHGSEEGVGHLGGKHPIAVLGEAGGVPDRLREGQAHEPAQEQVVFQLLAEAALRRDGVEVLDELGPQEILGRDGLSTPLVIKPVKERTEVPKGAIHHPADIPERVIGRDAVLQRGEQND